MFKRKKILSSLVICSMLFLSFVVFTINVEAETTIRFFHYIRGEERNIMLEMIDRFEEEYPDINVEFEFVPETDHMVKMQTMVAAGNAPDLIGLKDVMVPDMVRLGVLRPLEDLLTAEDSQINMDEWVSGLRDTLTINGHLWAVPEQFSPNILFYHKGLFDDAGVAPPSYGNRWEDILDYGKKLVQKNSEGKTEVFGFGGIPGRIDNFAGPLWNFGGSVLNPETNEYLLDSEPAKEVYRLARELVETGIAPRPDQQEGISHWEIERMAMQWNNRYIMPQYQTFDWAEENMRVAPHPVGPAGGRNRASMRVLTIPEASSHPEEANKLLQFLTSKEGYVGYTELGRVTPIYLDLVYGPQHQEMLNSFEDAGPYTYAVASWDQSFLPVQWEQVRKLTEDSMESIIRGMSSVDEEVEELNKAMTELYQELPPEERIFGGRP